MLNHNGRLKTKAAAARNSKRIPGSLKSLYRWMAGWVQVEIPPVQGQNRAFLV